MFKEIRKKITNSLENVLAKHPTACGVVVSGAGISYAASHAIAPIYIASFLVGAGTYALGESMKSKKRIEESERMLRLEVTEKKKAEEALRKSKQQEEKYLDVAGVMLATIDDEETITIMNKKGHEILGYEQGDLVGKNWFETLVPEGIRDEIRSPKKDTPKFYYD